MRTLASPSDKIELLRRLKSVQPASAARWGRMSAHQMVCHLADSLRMSMGEKRVTLDSNLFKRTLLKWLVLYVPLRWPPGILTSPEIDQGRGGTKPTDFAQDVAEFEALLEAVTAPRPRHYPQPHPFFGTMSDAEWLRWGYLHTDHHLRQFGA
jgi:hypothetical protein